MRVATALIFIFFLLPGCKALNFEDKKKVAQDGGNSASSDSDDSDADDTIALEPTAIGGAYLGCFIDPQLAPALDTPLTEDGVPVGCQVFEDSQFNQVKASHRVVVESGEWEQQGQLRAISIQTLTAHPRWAWASQISKSALRDSIFLQARSRPSAEPVRVRVELMDILPAGLLTSANASLEGAYRIRIKGTNLCADGNPIWGWDVLNKKPIVDPIQVDACSESLSFRFTRFEAGLRIHVPNPAPLTCDTENYAVEHCRDSCVDLENFGLGNRFVLWACTKTKEAQSYTLLPSQAGAVRIQANSRPMTWFGAVLIPDLGNAVDFEIIPVMP